MGMTASQIASLTFVYSTIYSGVDRRKHQSTASLAFAKGIHRWPVNLPHKLPVTQKMFPFDDIIMKSLHLILRLGNHRFHLGVWSSNKSKRLDYMTRIAAEIMAVITLVWETIFSFEYLEDAAVSLTHLPLDKMAAISQTISSDAFWWMKIFVFWLKFHWSLFLRVSLTITKHWFR